MTTRNFRVKNGLEVGDVTIDSSTNKITGLSTSTPSDPGDVATKAYVDAQVTASDLDFQADSGGALAIDLDSETLTFTGGTGIDTSGSGNAVTFAIDSTVATLAGTQTFTNKTFDANGTGNSISNIETADFASAAFKDEDNMASDSATAVASQQSIKAYVDAQDANIASDTLTFTNKTFDANGTGNSISNIEVADLASGVLDTDLSSVAGTDTTLASAKAIKAYVDSSISTAENADTTITVGNTSAVVSDTGSDGAFTVTADGNTELVVNDTSATFSGNVIVSGDFTVNGTTTTLNSTNKTITDALIELANGTTGAPANDGGIVIERGDQNNAFIGFDESEDKFRVGTGTFTGASTGNLTITTGTLLANIEGNVTGDVTGNADTATTLETARTIGGVSFNGSANINLPGVNTTGNQDTSGNAATATTATNATISANNSTNETVYLTFVDGATGAQGLETDTGLSYNPSTNVLSTTASAAQYADVAERFEADAPMEIGSVVEVGGTAEITEATSEMSEDVFGVISDKPAYMMNAGAGDNTTHPFVAMTGRTPVRVVGAVTKGQRLVTSSTKGCARAVAQGESISPFNVIGRALETNTEAGIKLVNCAVRTNN